MGFPSFGRVRSVTLGGLSGGALPIAIDFGVSCLKVLQLQQGDPPSLITAASVETPELFRNDPAKRLEFQYQALAKVARSAPFRGKRAVCAIPAGQMFCKHMQFPRADAVDLADLVRSAVPAALGCAPDALIYRHVAVDGATPPGSAGDAAGPGGGGAGPKQEVICLAAAREFVARLMGAIRDAKLEPVGMHPECFAFLRAFDNINQPGAGPSPATLYLDLAAGTTKVWVAHGPALVFAKTIALGGRDLDQAVSRSADRELAEARRMRLASTVLAAPVQRGGPSRAGGAGMAALAAAMAKEGAATAVAEDRRPDPSARPSAEAAPPEFDLSEPLETLTDEIAMCLRYYESLFGGRRVERAIFIGGESRHAPLCQHVARRLRLPAHVADPLARMGRTGKEPCLGVDFSTPQPGWAIPFGLSMCPTDL